VKVSGPAIILNDTQTVVLHPQNTATILKSHILYVALFEFENQQLKPDSIDVGLGPRKDIHITSVNPIQLSIFSHRFMGIAEQMCRALQQTAVSVSIKERLE
jgi:5-oxoprolinase (ATP-hydrolysing)